MKDKLATLVQNLDVNQLDELKKLVIVERFKKNKIAQQFNASLSPEERKFFK